jgi:DNA polymerase-3 subunit alpha (Gram-positive type)
MKNMLRLISPTSYCELIQISGFAHGTNVWLDNGNQLVKNGHSIVNLVAYRDDVFNYIQKKITDKGSADTGFAYKVMEDTRRGIYCNNGMPDSVKNGLRSIGAEDWFIESIGKIAYLFPKAHGVTYTKMALTLMWYKIHYPKEFNKIML